MAPLSCPIHGPQEDGNGTVCPVCMEFLVPFQEPLTVSCSEFLKPDERPEGGEARARQTTRDLPDADTATLEFPGGRLVQVRRELRVGRNPAWSPLGEWIDPDYDNVSRQHATISWRNGVLSVTDEGSTNGTFVNDRRIDTVASLPLDDGDVVRFGADLSATVHWRRGAE